MERSAGSSKIERTTPACLCRGKIHGAATSTTTSSVIDRLPIYAALGFPEIWQYVGDKIVIHLLQENGQYAAADQSLALTMVPVPSLPQHLHRSGDTDETTWIRAFREWVRAGMK